MTSSKNRTTHPKICDLCGREIKAWDKYYEGQDRYDIWALTCTRHDCVQWLVKKRKYEKTPEPEEAEKDKKKSDQKSLFDSVW